MSERKDAELLSDISESIRRIYDYSTGLTYQKFLKDTKTQDAILRNIEIIGEAAKGISPVFSGVNLDIVWDVVKEKLPELESSMKKIPS